MHDGLFEFEKERGMRMQAINDVRRCCIRVSCEISDFAANDASLITAVEIRRANNGTTRTIGTVPIAEQADLNFSFEDIYTVCGQQYQYLCIPVIGGASGVGAFTDVVRCVFSDVFIGNLDEQYVCAIDAEYNSKLNFSMNYVQTYHAPYPHAVSNGNQKYRTGSFSGVFLEMNENCQFVRETAGEYRRMVESFLATPKPKVIKTKEGDMWCIQVNGVVQEEPTGYEGISTLKFDWTEIAAPPVYGVVVITND